MSIKDLQGHACDRPDDEPARVARLGAARDGVESENGDLRVPRILRYAGLSEPREVAARIAADVAVLAPEVSGLAAAWASTANRRGWPVLSDALDAAAVHLDRPAARGLADVVRLVSMTVGELNTHRGDALRVLAALEVADDLCADWLEDARPQLAEVDVLRIGWARIVASQLDPALDLDRPAREAAYHGGEAIIRNIVAATEDETRRDMAAKTDRQRHEAAAVARAEAALAGRVGADAMVVCAAPVDQSTRGQEVAKAYNRAIGRALPLVAVADLAAVRRRLVGEYPYAANEVDRFLAPLANRPHASLPPTILVGPPGAGKSRFARRMAEALGVACWRTDGSRADGGTFGGTDRRWHTTEPCHPFLAVSRAGVANPLVIVDEIDKAATRADYGRLWDALLPFLERETSAAYPDPCLQADLDLSAVSYVMTANDIAALPPALVDRCRIIEFPEPRARDITTLLTSLASLHAEEAGLDKGWIEPLTGDEIAALARHWRGGSVRRLRALLDVVLRGRERLQPLH